MRSQEEILKRFKTQYDKHLSERLRRYLCRSFLNCQYNERHRVKGNGMVGFCTFNGASTYSKRKIVVCSDESTVNNCKFFRCCHTEESIKKDFDDILKNPAKCGQEYPKLATLIWVLQDTANDNEGEQG